MFKKKESGPPPLYILIILALFSLFFIIDGIASNSGLYNTNNNLRFASGALFGSAVAIIIFPVFIYQYYRDSQPEKLFQKPLKFLIYIAFLLIFITVTLFRINFSGYFFYYFTVFSVLFTFYFINLTVVLLIPQFSQKARRYPDKYLILPSMVSVFFLSLELLAFFWFHKIIYNLQSLI